MLKGMIVMRKEVASLVWTLADLLVFVDLLAVILLRQPITVAWEWGDERNGKKESLWEKLNGEA
jgi:ribose/xylose/arabinose/galactoside ABC-type transport system permease subunit